MDKHVCKVCFKEFVCQAKLVEHIRVHTGERPFACKVCDSRFKSNSHLQRHIRSHSDARAHACPHGCAAYKRKCHLTRHLAEKHAGGELIRCPRCGATFTRIHGYRRHVVRVHSKQAPPAQGAKERAVFEALRRHDPRFYQVVRDTPPAGVRGSSTARWLLCDRGRCRRTSHGDLRGGRAAARRPQDRRRAQAARGDPGAARRTDLRGAVQPRPAWRARRAQAGRVCAAGVRGARHGARRRGRRVRRDAGRVPRLRRRPARAARQGVL